MGAAELVAGLVAELVKAAGLALGGSALADGVAVPDVVGVGDAVGVLDGVVVAVLDGVELADALRESVVVVAGVVVAGAVDFADVLAVGFALALLVLAPGVALADVEDALADVADALADVEDALAEGDGSLVGVGDAELCVVDGSLVEGALVEAFGLADVLAELVEPDTVGVGLGVVGVGVGVALGDDVAACSGSHCCTVPLDVTAASVMSAG